MFDMKSFFNKVEIDLNDYFYNNLHLPLEIKLNLEFINKNLNILKINIKLIKGYHFFIEKLNMDNLIEEVLNHLPIYLLTVDIGSLVIDNYSDDEVIFSFHYKVGSDNLYALNSVEKFYLDLKILDFTKTKVIEMELEDLNDILPLEKLNLLSQCKCFYIYDEESLTLIRHSNNLNDSNTFNKDIFYKELSKGLFCNNIEFLYELKDNLKDSIIIIRLFDFLK